MCDENSYNNPFLSITLAVKNTTASSIVQNWYYREDTTNSYLNQIINLILFNPEQMIKKETKYHIESGQLHQINTGYFASLFFAVENYYAITLFYRLNQLKQTPENIRNITIQLKLISLTIKHYLVNSKPIQSLNSIIVRTFDNLVRFTNQHISVPVNVFSTPSDIQFLSVLLTSHFETQMTTVIEGSDPAQCFQLASFLANFTLPEQLYHSTFEHLKRPIPGLHIQCIMRQMQDPIDMMITFPSSCTWIRLPEMIIAQTPGNDDQIAASTEYLETSVLCHDHQEELKRLARIKKHYKITPKKDAAPWVIATMVMVSQANPQQRQKLCQLRLQNLLNIAKAAINLTHEIIQPTSKFLLFEKVKEIWEMLGLSGKEDMYLVACVGQILDPTIQGKLFTNRRGALEKISNVS